MRHDRGGADCDEIVEWGEDNLPFLRRFLSYHHGVPGSRWLRALLNRIDPALFAEMFQSWAETLRPDAPALVAIDGKTSRGSRDAGKARAALHLVSAFATRESWFWRRRRSPRGPASRRRPRFCWSVWRRTASCRARSRTGHGPMAVVRRFDFSMLKAVADKRSLKLRKNKAARNADRMARIVGAAR